MHRLFAALRPPPAMRSLLLDRMGGGIGIRWQRDDQLHLTLRFIGEVDRHRAADVAAALGSVRTAPIDFALAGAGLFDRRGVPDSLWAGVAPATALKQLHDRIDAALRRIGVAPDTRAYLPHITVARLSRGAAPLAALVEQWSGLSSDAAAVGHFELYESELGADGASYTAIERYSLD